MSVSCWRCPIPRKQLLQPGSRRSRDTGKDIGESRLRIDAVEFYSHDQSRHEGAAIRSDPPNNHDFPPSAKHSLGGVVR